MSRYLFKQCNKPSHEKYDQAIICICESCEYETRFACVKCIKEFHSDHVQECIMMEDLLDDKLQQLPQASTDLVDQITQLKKVIEDTGAIEDIQIDEIFEEFTISLVKGIELERFKLRNKYKQKQSLYADLIKELIDHFTSFFNLKYVRQHYDDFARGKIDSQQFDTELNQHIKSAERNELRNKLQASYQQCLNKIPNINQDEIEYLKEKVTAELFKLKDLVRVVGNWFFIAPKIMNYNNNLSPKEGGYIVEFGTQDSQQYVHGSLALKGNFIHQWTYKFEELSQGMSYNTVYIGLVLDNYKEDLNQMFSYGKCVYLDINTNTFTQYLTLKAGKKQLCQVIKDNTAKKQPTLITFTLDLKSKSLVIQDGEDLTKYEYSKKLLKKMISSQPSSIAQLNIHLSYFKNGNAFRPIIMNYSGTFKVTLQ